MATGVGEFQLVDHAKEHTEKGALKAPTHVWKRRLPRDTPFWLLNIVSDPEKVGSGRAPVPSEVIALSSGGDGRACLYSQADDALAALAVEAEVECIDDASWLEFPEFGAALSRLFSKEECICVALCPSRSACAVGVSMSTRMRKLSAKVALAVTLALRHESPTTALENCPFIHSLLSAARQARQEDDGCPKTSAVVSPLPRNGNAGTPKQRLRISSPLLGSTVHWAEHAADATLRQNLVEELDVWLAHCVCCKRPLTLSLEDRPAAKKRTIDEKRYAYVCAVWGTDPQFVLGAMVLAWSLRRTGTKHDLVAMYTEDVSTAAVKLLNQSGWRVRKIPYMRACSAFFWPNTRFMDVFTKLHCFGLVEYEKILMLDSDLLVGENLDHLFDMQPPAAMARGICTGYIHGQRIDGRCFFGGKEEAEYSWGQNSGINAGVMLLEPSLETLDQFLQEVQDPMHPEHIRGSGPEQDYLSRFFAGQWTHIDVSYNYQLHQMYFQFSPLYNENGDRTELIRNPTAIKVFHYSSAPKPWSRHMDTKYENISDLDWLREVQSQFRGYRSWVLKDPEYLQDERGFENMILGEDGEIYHASYVSGKDGEHIKVREERIVMPTWIVDAVETVTKRALCLWDQAYHELAADMKIPKLASAVVSAVADEDTATNANATANPTSEPDGHDSMCWRSVDSWCPDQDAANGHRVTLLASMLPEACAVVSLNGKQLFSAKGKGIHVMVLETTAATELVSPPSVRSFQGDETAEAASEWTKTVSDGMLVLMAIVDAGDVRLATFIKELTACLGPQNLAFPKGCTVAVAAGKKGEVHWADSHASFEVATLVLGIP